MSDGILQKVRSAGVIGAGGAGFPTYAKLSGGIETIVVNGAECEPLLRVDQQLMEHHTEKVVRGLEAVIKVTGAREGVIATKAKYKAGIAALGKAISDDRIRLHLMDDFYPAGDEQVTVREVTGKVVPQGGIPLKVGCVVVNVETLVNVADALDNKPVTQKYITVTGEVDSPRTIKVPVGTPAIKALNLAGIKHTDELRVIDGGPMMGKLLDNLEQPVGKTTKGLIALPANHPVIRKRTQSSEKIIRQAKSACIQCRYCTDLCPRFLLGHKLEPHRIMRAVRNTETVAETLKMAFACTECGVCEQYACFMDLSPRTVNAMLKREFSRQGIKPDAPPSAQSVEAMQEHRKIPVKRLIARLGLTGYDKPAPFSDADVAVDKVAIMLKQHVGVPSKPVVEAGQSVRQGDVIAEAPADALGANIHASISGKVIEVSDRIVLASEGKQQ